MKSKYAIMLASLIAFSAAEAKAKEVVAPVTSSSHASIGHTFFTFKGVDKSSAMEMEQGGLYAGARGELTYLQTQGIVAGLMGVYAPGVQTSYHTQTDSKLTSGMKASTYLWQLEGKLGRHMIVNDKTTLVPFAGIGTYHVGSTLKVKSAYLLKESVNQMNMDWGYLMAGATANYSFNTQLDLGASIKILRHFYSLQQDVVNSVESETKLHAKWGYELSAPIKFYPDRSESWHLSAEPFMLKIDTTSAVNVYGARLNVHRSF